ncbi:MAG: cyclic nucleotide-binding domain-containing protein [Acidimicrobiia bacterium]
MARTWQAVRAVLRTPDLRRAQTAYAGFNVAEQATWVAMLVYAFNRGGATEAGIISLVQLVPAALAAPFLGTLADRVAPTKVQTFAYAAQAAATSAVATVLLLDGPASVAYALAAVAATLFTISRPAQAALTPALSRSPLDLGAAMVTSGWIENASVLVAPALAGVVLATTGVGELFAVAAALSALSALLIAPLRATDPDPRRGAADDFAASGWEEVTGGFRALRRNGEARLVVGFFGLEHIGWGAIDLLAVVLALGILDLGNGGAGYLEAAFGAGGLVGIAVAMGVLGGRRLAPVLLGGALGWGAALVVLGLAPSTAAAFALFVVAGAGRSVLDLSARTLLLRVAPPAVVSRVFGIAEGLSMVGLAIGAVLVPVLVELGGPEAALIGTGVVVAGLALVRARSVWEVDAAANVPVVELALLRRLRIFSPLPATSLEALARALVVAEHEAGTVIVETGEEGDRYYAISDGEVEIVRDGQRVARLGRGEGFGEVALLHDIPRTATVRAITRVTLFALDREPFTIALTGHESTASMARAIAAERAGEVDPAGST